MKKNNFKRLYIFTGKGGVGKTTLSISFCEHLKSQNKKVLYTYFSTSKLQKNAEHLDESIQLARSLDIETLGLDLLEASKKYIGKKLKSTTIASWIVKTPFYQSLINMIPGFSYVIFMGQLIEFMEDDPNLTIVLDSPSSGHALTMLESTKNFSQIFEGGLVYEDTKHMVDTLNSENFTKVNIIALPTLLAIHEAQELKSSIEALSQYPTEIYYNNCLKSFETNSLPDFLKKKIHNENKALAVNNNPKNEIAYHMSQTPQKLIKDLLPSMNNLV